MCARPLIGGIWYRCQQLAEQGSPGKTQRSGSPAHTHLLPWLLVLGRWVGGYFWDHQLFLRSVLSKGYIDYGYWVPDNGLYVALSRFRSINDFGLRKPIQAKDIHATQESLLYVKNNEYTMKMLTKKMGRDYRSENSYGGQNWTLCQEPVIDYHIVWPQEIVWVDREGELLSYFTGRKKHK